MSEHPLSYIYEATSPRVERRFTERRMFGLTTLIKGTTLCRRHSGRRTADRLGYYVDWYAPHLLYITVAIIALSAIDAVITLYLIQHGLIEINPIMALLMQHDIGLFVATKIGVTSVAILFLVVHHTFWLFKRLPVSTLIYAALALYLGLIGYEGVLVVRTLS